MIYILAANSQSARGIATRMGIPRNQWKFIDSPFDMYGARNPCVLKAQYAYRHPDYSAICRTLDEIGSWIWTETTR